jgi:transcriptional regulator with XRE-family HTH domain
MNIPSLSGDISLGRPPGKRAPDVLRQELAQNLLRYRTGAGLSQRDLAERTGLTQAHISNLENARANATLDTINTLAKALGVDPRDLTKS